jgi:hypothetical protein
MCLSLFNFIFCFPCVAVQWVCMMVYWLIANIFVQVRSLVCCVFNTICCRDRLDQDEKEDEIELGLFNTLEV